MVDFDKAAINSFEENFLAVTSGCFLLPKCIPENSIGGINSSVSRRYRVSLEIKDVTKPRLCSRTRNCCLFQYSNGRLSRIST